MRIGSDGHQTLGREEQVIGHPAYSARFSSFLKDNHGWMGVRIEGHPVAGLPKQVIGLLEYSHHLVKPLQWYHEQIAVWTGDHPVRGQGEQATDRLAYSALSWGLLSQQRSQNQSSQSQLASQNQSGKQSLPKDRWQNDGMCNLHLIYFCD